MGNVIVTFKIMPSGVDVDLDNIVEKIRAMEGVRLNAIEKKPVAFGLFSVVASFIVADAAGVVDELEKKIKKIEGVQSIEVVDLSLI